ncbi:hypothetical protein ATEIFO6365_0006044500 [Aspergillus terreus]|uniref:Uncharacterized protein n=1 Tax=Aspergillus terreus TaxID=33178 RepID=A0A5M3Z0R7_ASPTE|nr:hypothetical protein ATETN484_0005044300 [Aspergillus terreus]GFF17108.1 hypothetical protein ATEIFO6365_0006044500 [Aspergillus terreus]
MFRSRIGRILRKAHTPGNPGRVDNAPCVFHHIDLRSRAMHDSPEMHAKELLVVFAELGDSALVDDFANDPGQISCAVQLAEGGDGLVDPLIDVFGIRYVDMPEDSSATESILTPRRSSPALLVGYPLMIGLRHWLLEALRFRVQLRMPRQLRQ